MAWNLHAIEQARLRQHRVDGVGRLKSDFHTGLRLCLWCLCSLCSSSEAMVMVGSPRARQRGSLQRDAGAAAAAQRSMDRFRGSGLPLRVRCAADGCPLFSFD